MLGAYRAEDMSHQPAPFECFRQRKPIRNRINKPQVDR